MTKDNAFPGARVWYRSSPGRVYAGTIDCLPFQLGNGTWCVHLRDMSPQYGDATGRTRVNAAALDALVPHDSWIGE